jgi:hypothetical protein
VRKIQLALIKLDSAPVTPNGSFDAATAAAVLAFKTKRGIINRSYQSTPDNIVGRMTVAALDKELSAAEVPSTGTPVCVLSGSCHGGASGGSASGHEAVTVVAVSGPADEAARIRLAFSDSRRTLVEAIARLGHLQQVLVRSKLPGGGPLAADEQKVLDSAVKWLNLKPSEHLATLIHLATAVRLMQLNLAVKNSRRELPEAKRVNLEIHGQVVGNPDTGIELGNLFFGRDGRNCRRDVITHEFFHFLGVKHGGGALMGPTIRSAITTPAQALDSADNLAQLVAELTTPSGNTDACARAGE